MSQHSSIVGGSTAARLINCPASFQTIMALPPSIEQPSDYAEEGSAMHAVMDALMQTRMSVPEVSLLAAANRWVAGKTLFHDRALTAEHVDTMIEPALEALDELENEFGGGFQVIAVEKQFKFPGIIGAFGTLDLILANESCVLCVDWKFGQGLPVLASDENGFNINGQLLFYVTAARSALWGKLFKNRIIIGAIIQPRAEICLSFVEIGAGVISTFKRRLQAAVDDALKPQPHRERGEWCRFAPCKVTCPLWTGPVLDLSVLKPATREVATNKPTAYGDFLAKAKTLCDMAAMYKQEIDEQLHAYLEEGGIVPGWRLKLKTKQRQWVDEGVVAKELKQLGFADAEIWQSKLVTFSAADATAKRRKVKIPDALRVAPTTTETTVAPSDDPAPVVERSAAIEQFRESLKRLSGGG